MYEGSLFYNAYAVLSVQYMGYYLFIHHTVAIGIHINICDMKCKTFVNHKLDIKKLMFWVVFFRNRHLDLISKVLKIKAKEGRFIFLLYLIFLSVQASTFLQITACVQSVTAIPWEHRSVVVRARRDSVCVPILQWEGGAVTNVVRCSSVSTLVWAGNLQVNCTQTNSIYFGCASCKAFIY